MTTPEPGIAKPDDAPPDPVGLAGSTSSSPARRSALIDNAKAIGIVLVVAGHAPAMPVALIDFIFAFHMPLFFFLSGLLVDASKLRLPTATRAVALGRSLLVPYLFYFVVSYLYWLVVKRHGLRAAEFDALSWWQPLPAILEPTGNASFINVALWFFPCLFVVSLVHHVARRRWSGVMTAGGSILVALLFVGGLLPGGPRWPFAVDSALVALPFFSTGALCRSLLDVDTRRHRPGRIFVGIVALGACFLLSSVTGRIDLNYLMFGRIPLLFVPATVFGIVGIVALSSALPASRLARWLSANTLTIFPLHFLLFSVFTGLALKLLQLPPDFKTSSALVGVVYTIGALVLCWPAAVGLARFVPWVVKRPRALRARSTISA